MRGYAAVRQRILLQPYYSARAALPVSFARLRQVLTDLKMPGTRAVLEDAVRTNRRWVAVVASRPSHSGACPPECSCAGSGSSIVSERIWISSKFIGRSRESGAAPRAASDLRCYSVRDRSRCGGDRRCHALYDPTVPSGRAARANSRACGSGAPARAESRSAYEAEKRIADTLQGAFTQNLLPRMARVLFSATYVPAAEEARIGGDWYDVLNSRSIACCSRSATLRDMGSTRRSR